MHRRQSPPSEVLKKGARTMRVPFVRRTLPVLCLIVFAAAISVVRAQSGPLDGHPHPRGQSPTRSSAPRFTAEIARSTSTSTIRSRRLPGRSAQSSSASARVCSSGHSLPVSIPTAFSGLPSSKRQSTERPGPEPPVTIASLPVASTTSAAIHPAGGPAAWEYESPRRSRSRLPPD